MCGSSRSVCRSSLVGLLPSARRSRLRPSRLCRLSFWLRRALSCYLADFGSSPPMSNTLVLCIAIFRVVYGALWVRKREKGPIGTTSSILGGKDLQVTGLTMLVPARVWMINFGLVTPGRCSISFHTVPQASTINPCHWPIQMVFISPYHHPCWVRTCRNVLSAVLTSP